LDSKRNYPFFLLNSKCREKVEASCPGQLNQE
jgi:hypothetical protein